MGEAMDNKINRAIQLLLEDQPVYYVGAHTGQEISYKAGLNAAQTWADYINIGFDMERLIFLVWESSCVV